MDLIKKNLFLIIGVTILTIGNIWCYVENDRPLKPLTNLVVVGLLMFNFKIKTK